MKIAPRTWVLAAIAVAGVFSAPMLKKSVWPAISGFLSPEASEDSGATKKQRALDDLSTDASDKER